MLKIRLQRTGRKHEPTFRLVLTDSKNSTKSGKYLEILGYHDPRFSEKTSLMEDKIKYWISKGAQVSGTVFNMLVDKKIVEGTKINVLPKKSPIKKEIEEEVKTKPKLESVESKVETEPESEKPVESNESEEKEEAQSEKAQEVSE